MKKFWFWAWPFLLIMLCVAVVGFDLWVDADDKIEKSTATGSFFLGFLLAWIVESGRRSKHRNAEIFRFGLKRIAQMDSDSEQGRLAKATLLEAVS